MNTNRIKKLTPLAETKFLNLYDAEYENKNKKLSHWTVASRKDFKTLSSQYFQGAEEKMDATIIAALHNESRKIVCIRQFRIPLNDYVFELPAGLIDTGEDYEKASARELKEETGLDIIKINHERSRKGVYASAGMTDESAAIVFCTCSGNISYDGLEEDEDIEIMLFSVNEVKELLKTDVKIDMRAFITLQAFVLLGEKLFE
ncbi:NUDIX hydrolase [Clostridium akagii]|uniref:NUDIX hydrolase n=1 Tax=Clostridium akagii TaxID=91623 RepID=UPI00047E8368|nr:NUDIX hydrolase [Clostridium akagii]